MYVTAADKMHNDGKVQVTYTTQKQTRYLWRVHGAIIFSLVVYRDLMGCCELEKQDGWRGESSIKSGGPFAFRIKAEKTKPNDWSEKGHLDSINRGR